MGEEQNEVTLKLPWHELSDELRRQLLICMRRMVPELVSKARDLSHAWEAAVKALESYDQNGPTERASIEPGTVVQLKSGGPKMVAGKTASDSVVSCYWANDMGSYSGAFPADCLQVAESPGIPSFLRVQTARLTEKLGFPDGMVADAVSFAISEHLRACFLYQQLCKLANEPSDSELDEEALAGQVAEKLKEAASLSALAGILTPEQAELLKLWRATYFEGGAMREAFLNVLRLRLWGHEIRAPELLQLAETDITTDTLSLLEALIASPDET